MPFLSFFLFGRFFFRGTKQKVMYPWYNQLNITAAQWNEVRYRLDSITQKHLSRPLFWKFQGPSNFDLVEKLCTANKKCFYFLPYNYGLLSKQVWAQLIYLIALDFDYRSLLLGRAFLQLQRGVLFKLCIVYTTFEYRASLRA